MFESQKLRKTKTAVILSLFLIAAAEMASSRILAAETNQDPIIGKNTDHITFDKGIASKTLGICNAGSGTLSYDIAIVEGEDYFSVTPNSGESQGHLEDIKIHTVTVNYSAMSHGETVAGLIEITNSTNTNNSPQYIALTATETPACHVRRIEIEQGIDYGTTDRFAPNQISAEASWIDGNTGPQVWSIGPDAPKSSDVIYFTGPTGTYSNDCFASIQLGEPTVTIDRLSRRVELWFEPAQDKVCPAFMAPVCGLQGSFGPLEPGDWVFFCNGPKNVKGLTFSIPFHVQTAQGTGTAGCIGTGLTGDFDCDGVVDFNDFSIFAQQWGRLGNDIGADVFPACGDATVDSRDLASICENWLKEGRVGLTYDFSLTIESDDNVAGIEFVSPEGNLYEISDENHTESEHTETWHTEKDGVHTWKHQEWFNDANGLTNYWDGLYSITVHYTDGDSNETFVEFGVPNKPGSIAQTTQKPLLTLPSPGAAAVSPIRFGWEKCSDANAGSIRLSLVNRCGTQQVERQFVKGAGKTGYFNLDSGRWLAELRFGRWYEAKSDDGIDINIGKCTRSRSTFEVAKQFGSFNGKTSFPLRLTDCNANEIKFSLTGGGSGRVEGDCTFNRIVLSGTTAKSILNITTPRGRTTTVGDIIVNGDIRAITGRNVDVKGDVLIQGGASIIVLNNIEGSRKLTIGPSASPKSTCVLKFGRIEDLNLASRTPIRELNTTEWLSGLLDAPWISTMIIKGNRAAGTAGDFGAELRLNGTGSPKGMALNRAKIAGELGATEWDVNGNCGSIEFAASSEGFDAYINGAVRTLKAVGNKYTGINPVLSGQWGFKSVGTISAGDIEWCTISAGPAEKAEKPAIGNITVKRWISQSTIESASDISTITAGGLLDSDCSASEDSIGRVRIMGIAGSAYCFTNSNIGATHIGSAYLAYPKTLNNNMSFGLTAGSIDKLTIKNASWTKTWTNLKAGQKWPPMGDFEINLE